MRAVPKNRTVYSGNVSFAVSILTQELCCLIGKVSLSRWVVSLCLHNAAAVMLPCFYSFLIYSYPICFRFEVGHEDLLVSPVRHPKTYLSHQSDIQRLTCLTGQTSKDLLVSPVRHPKTYLSHRSDIQSNKSRGRLADLTLEVH